MSRRKPPTVADLAAGAAHGKRVVMSCGSLDGAFLAALAKVQLSFQNDNSPSTWADGIDTSNVESDKPKGGVSDGKNAFAG